MGRQNVKLKDQVFLKLYDSKGNLKQESNAEKKYTFLERFLLAMIKRLEKDD